MKEEKQFYQRMLLSDKEVVFESKLLGKIYHAIICTDKCPFDAPFHGNYGRESREGGAIKMNDYLPFHRRKGALIEGRVGTFFFI